MKRAFLGIFALAACAQPPGGISDSQIAAASALVDQDVTRCAEVHEDRPARATCYANARQTRYREAGANALLLSTIGEIDAYLIELARTDKTNEELEFLYRQIENEVFGRVNAQIESAAAQQRAQAVSTYLAIQSQQRPIQVYQAPTSSARTIPAPTMTSCQWLGNIWTCSTL